VRLALTDAGRRQMRALFHEQSDREQAWVGALTSAEQHVLVILLNKLIASRTDFDVRTRS
jgi:MarR family transcriptional repressor of emrRAB